MNKVLYIAMGGAIGSVLRYYLAIFTTSYLAERFTEYNFPYGTLLVNILGSLLIGIIAGLFFEHDPENNLKLFLIIGILGGFTTFSSFSLETITLFLEGDILIGFLYIILSVMLGLIACLLGLYISGALPLK